MTPLKKHFTLLITLSIISTILSANNWTMGNNSIKINYYESKLTDEQRDNYYYWIGLRNSFYYYEDMNQLEKLVTYFAPENDDYYPNLFAFITPFCLFGGAVAICIVIYLVRRFVLKGCRGPKIIEHSYHTVTYTIIGMGFFIGFISLCFTLYHANKSE